jgi:hypothetical protein
MRFRRALVALLWWLHVPFAFVADYLLGVRVELLTPRHLRRWGEPWRWARNIKRGIVP